MANPTPGLPAGIESKAALTREIVGVIGDAPSPVIIEKAKERGVSITYQEVNNAKAVLRDKGQLKPYTPTALAVIDNDSVRVADIESVKACAKAVGGPEQLMKIVRLLWG